MPRNNALETHQRDAILENIAFLRANGMHDELIAKRLGMKLNTMQKMAGHGPQDDPDE